MDIGTIIGKTNNAIEAYKANEYMSDLYSVNNSETLLLYANRIAEDKYPWKDDNTIYSNNMIRNNNVRANPNATYVSDLEVYDIDKITSKDKYKLVDMILSFNGKDHSKSVNRHISYLFYSLDCKYPVLDGLLNKPQIIQLNSKRAIGSYSDKLLKKFFMNENEENMAKLIEYINSKGNIDGYNETSSFENFYVDYDRFDAISEEALNSINSLDLKIKSVGNSFYYIKEDDKDKLRERALEILNNPEKTMTEKKKLIVMFVSVSQAFRSSVTYNEKYINYINKYIYNYINNFLYGKSHKYDYDTASIIQINALDLKLQFIKYENNKIYFKSNYLNIIKSKENLDEEIKNIISETYSRFDIIFVIDCNGTYRHYIYIDYEYNTETITHYLKFKKTEKGKEHIDISRNYLSNYILPDNGNVPVYLKTLREYLYLKRYIIEVYSAFTNNKKFNINTGFNYEGLYSLLLLENINDIIQISHNNNTHDKEANAKINNPMFYTRLVNKYTIPIQSELKDKIIKLDDFDVSGFNVDFNDIKLQLQTFIINDIYFKKLQEYIQAKIQGIELSTIADNITNNLILYSYDGKIFMYVDGIDVLMDAVKQEGYKYTDDEEKKNLYYELLFLLKGIINLVCVIIDGETIVFNRTNALYTGALMNLDYLKNVYLNSNGNPYKYYKDNFRGIKTGMEKDIDGIINVSSYKRFSLVRQILENPTNTTVQMKIFTYNLFRLCLLPNMEPFSENQLSELEKFIIRPEYIIPGKGVYYDHNRYLFITTFKANQVLFNKYSEYEIDELEEKIRNTNDKKVKEKLEEELKNLKIQYKEELKALRETFKFKTGITKSNSSSNAPTNKILPLANKLSGGKSIKYTKKHSKYNKSNNNMNDKMNNNNTSTLKKKHVNRYIKPLKLKKKNTYKKSFNKSVKQTKKTIKTKNIKH
jgi:hypothetical protein